MGAERTVGAEPGRAVRRGFLFAPLVLLALGSGALYSRGSQGRSNRLLRVFGLRWEDLRFPGQWYRIFTSPYVQSAGDLGFSLLVLLALFVLSEYRFGTKRTIVTFVLTDVLSSLLILIVLRALELRGWAWASVIHERDGGASSGSIGVAVALIASTTRRWLRRSMAMLLAITLLVSLVWSRELADRQHVIAALAGFGLVAGERRARRLPDGKFAGADPSQIPEEFHGGAAVRPKRGRGRQEHR